MNLGFADLSWKDNNPFSESYGDFYSSKKGSYAEAKHVFIEGNRLQEKFLNLEAETTFSIVEVGFGAGINFLTTCQEWLKEDKSNQFLDYIAFDKALFNIEDFKKTIKQCPELKEVSTVYINNYPTNISGTQRIYFEDQRISLTLILGDIKSSLSYLTNASNIDVWYLDGFAPDKNPDMWSKEIFKQMHLSSHKDTTFSTFTSARLVKNNLEQSGFIYELAEGFSNKRHMLKGKAQSDKVKEGSKKKIAVIGSGIAGSILAYKLAQRGHEVDVYEQNEAACSGASGNDILITYPRLSAFDSPYARFCLHSFLFASSFYDQLKTNAWHNSGVLLMSHDESSLKRQNSLLNARSDNELFEELSHKEASKRAGLQLNNGGILFEKGGYIEPKALCQDLLSQKNINLKLSSTVEKIDLHNNNLKLIINGEVSEYQDVCLCAGYTSKELLSFSGLSPKRGQISYVDSSKEFENLKFPICASGYFSPKIKGSHVLGSSYSDVTNDSVLEEEHISNKKKLKVIHNFNVNIHGGNVGFRAVTKDRLPLVGCNKGIYVNTGHGSRGSTSSPLCAEIIADLIDNKPLPVDHEVAIALDVNRFS